MNRSPVALAALALLAASTGAAGAPARPGVDLRQALQQFQPVPRAPAPRQLTPAERVEAPAPRQLTPEERAELRRQLGDGAQRPPRH